jgi:pantothenate synthetase
VLYWSLLAGKRAVEEQRVKDVAEVRAAMTAVARREELVELDYAEVVDPGTLSVPPAVGPEVRLLIAGRTGKARLIDNLAANGAED